MIGWEELEKEFRCVIQAEAGAGKSFKMEVRTKYALGTCRTSFFIRIDDFEGVFESWLDSHDETRIENPRSFEKAIKLVARWIEQGEQRARILSLVAHTRGELAPTGSWWSDIYPLLFIVEHCRLTD